MYWLYSGGLTPIAELDSADNVIKRFAAGYIIKADTFYRVVTDHLGSVRMIVNTVTGAVVQKIDYDEYGNVIYVQNENQFFDLTYAGGLYDSETGLVRFGARDYDPSTGRWTCKDPIWFGGGVSNIYEYCLNDPVNRIDLIGLQVIQGSSGVGGSYALFGGVHGEFNVGFSIDIFDVLNSKIFFQSQQSLLMGGIAEGFYGVVGGFGYSSNQLPNGFSSQTIIHSEANLGVEGIIGGSLDIPFNIDPCDKKIDVNGAGLNFNLKGRVGGGGAGYLGGGIGVNEYYTFPSLREILNYGKNIWENIKRTLRWFHMFSNINYIRQNKLFVIPHLLSGIVFINIMILLPLPKVLCFIIYLVYAIYFYLKNVSIAEKNKLEKRQIDRIVIFYPFLLFVLYGCFLIIFYAITGFNPYVKFIK